MNWRSILGKFRIGSIIKINPDADLSDWNTSIASEYQSDIDKEYIVDSEWMIAGEHQVDKEFLKEYFILVR